VSFAIARLPRHLSEIRAIGDGTAFADAAKLALSTQITERKDVLLHPHSTFNHFTVSGTFSDGRVFFSDGVRYIEQDCMGDPTKWTVRISPHDDICNALGIRETSRGFFERSRLIVN
jgi:hypothetical protein